MSKKIEEAIEIIECNIKILERLDQDYQDRKICSPKQSSEGSMLEPTLLEQAGVISEQLSLCRNFVKRMHEEEEG